MDEDRKLYFLEMNTRVQVEHPVTEMATGLDLVALQIKVAAGEEIDLPDTRPWAFRGHAIECRINAEDPKSFAPWPGLITEYHPPGGAGVRIDSGVYGGWKVPSDYDSLLAKLIVHAPTRGEAIVRMRRALAEFIVGGIRTNIPLHRRLLEDAEVISGEMTTRTIERLLADDAEKQAQ
jgi:acetyl-CoA carboxylase biotin carboxylase subunit